MNTETIDLNIGGVDFSRCLVDFEYEFADKGSSVQPPYPEQLTIYRVQFICDYAAGFDMAFWADLQEQHFCMVELQVLDWIHEQQEESYTDMQMRKMENEEFRYDI